eukprot:s4232_g4.t1
MRRSRDGLPEGGCWLVRTHCWYQSVLLLILELIGHGFAFGLDLALAFAFALGMPPRFTIDSIFCSRSLPSSQPRSRNINHRWLVWNWHLSDDGTGVSLRWAGLQLVDGPDVFRRRRPSRREHFESLTSSAIDEVVMPRWWGT